MKKSTIIMTFIIFCSLLSFSQTELPIHFKANEKATIDLGKSWNNDYKTLDNKLNVKYNGDSLRMYWDSGKTFWKTNVLSHKYRKDTEFGDLNREIFILKIKKEGFINYVLIEKDYEFGDVIPTIKIPYRYKTGEIISYDYYQKF